MGEIQPCIHFGKVSRGSVERKIGSQREKIVPHNTRKVNNRIGSQTQC